MLVALLIGTIRTIARFTSDPAEILQELNSRLAGRSDARATCLALHISSTGEVTVVNAGHFPPYLNGLATEMEGSLPLGMIDAPPFSTKHLALAESDSLTIVSDGVIEATDQGGKLFGFERTTELLRSGPSAKEIADTAQMFGQTDDITVLSIARVRITQPAPAICNDLPR
jgi:serine phosphatase RsbU (regulator of sigma subunit)